ncbi:MAG: OprO/OprP family phosphate-selective porin, partial [Gammaproteobacteria bacterium]|nr:OprO/OprP family phosphate-selective porin [Gammaproteobacteria bacterium]
IKQEVGDDATSVAPTGGEWVAWYAQAAYRFNPSNWEAVLRYSEYDTPHASQDRNQTAIGVNYVFSSNFIGKLNYEINENPNAGLTAGDRVLVQLAYGF